MVRTVRSLAVALLLISTAGLIYAENGDSVVTEVIYGHKDGMALSFDVFKPEKPNGAGLLFMVSGGWVSRYAPPAQYKSFFNAPLDAGFTIFAVRHGSSPRYKVPEAYSDVKRALRYINLHAAEWGVDPNRLGVFGGSAGGHLSLMLGCTCDAGDAAGADEVEKAPSKVEAVVAYFPPVDLRTFVGVNERFPALDFDKELADDVSPILFVTKDDPPSLMIHGDKDDLVPLQHSKDIYAKFQEVGVTTDLIVLPGAGHGFQGEDAKKAADALVAWFEKTLAKK